MQQKQNLERNISVNSVSCKRFAVAFKLSVSRSSGFVWPNSAGMLDKSCFITAKAFNISD
jgi:hypothetical protein